MREKTVSLGIGLVFLFLALGVFNLQVIRGSKFRELSDRNSIRLLPQEGSRGRILDRNGNVIVHNLLSYDVVVLPKNSQRLEIIFAALAKILATDQNDLRGEYRKNFITASMPVAVARNIDLKKVIALEEVKADLGDVFIQPHPLRHYPYGKLACHVIGYLSEIDRLSLTRLADYGYKTKDIVGFGGVEEKYDYYLRQEEGALSVEVDHRGRFVRALGFRPAQDGKDIELTIDLNAQKIVEDALADREGSVVVVDPYSGEVIAMASSPGFNPSVFIKRSQPSIVALFKDSDAPLLNRAISGVYPPASVFKLVVATAALETGKVNLATSFFCSGSAYIGRRQFACWDTHGQQNIINAIAHSCNVFFYRIGLLAGAQIIHDYALKFGCGKVVPIDLPYGQSGFVPDPLWRRIHKLRNWFDGDTANLAIGQGELMVTPLQMVRMAAVFANKGMLVNPYLVKEVNGQGISIHQKKASIVGIKESTINYIRQGMQEVISDPKGTANVLADLDISVAGKTGTAQVPHGLAHGWFVGFFPFKNPKFAICVFLEHGVHGNAAAVIAKQIIEQMNKEGLIVEKL